MAKVRCKIVGCSDLIDGVNFHGDPGNKISEDISVDIAAQFARVDGFEIVESGVSVSESVDVAIEAGPVIDAVIEEPEADKPKRGRKKP